MFKDGGYRQPWTWSRAHKLTLPDVTIVYMNVPCGPAHLCTLHQPVLPSYMKTAAVGFGLNCSSHENLQTRESAEQIVNY